MVNLVAAQSPGISSSVNILDIQKLKFQDNAGQTYANQPTKLIVKVNGLTALLDSTYFQPLVELVLVAGSEH